MFRFTAIVAFSLLTGTIALLPSSQQQQQSFVTTSIARSSATADTEIATTTVTPEQSRRSMMGSFVGGMASLFVTSAFPVQVASAKQPDCLADCIKNCKQVVPNDTSNYCRDSCMDYCEQPDRRDGLSGSISSEGGEVGILGGTFGQGTVVKGEDKPPTINLPGLNFQSGEGRKLLGL